MANKIVMKLTVDEQADPELYQYLSSIFPRRRAERVRILAANGMRITTAISVNDFKEGKHTESKTLAHSRKSVSDNNINPEKENKTNNYDEEAIFNDITDLE